MILAKYDREIVDESFSIFFSLAAMLPSPLFWLGVDGKLGGGPLVAVFDLSPGSAFLLFIRPAGLGLSGQRNHAATPGKGWVDSTDPTASRQGLDAVGQSIVGLAPAQVWGGEATDHVISIGEHLEIPSRGLKRFSVTDQQVISYKWLEQQVHFLVEGKKLGYSELIIWDGGGQKTTHRFYVLSKRSFLKAQENPKDPRGYGA